MQNVQIKLNTISQKMFKEFKRALTLAKNAKLPPTRQVKNGALSKIKGLFIYATKLTFKKCKKQTNIWAAGGTL
jgi:hypothetical protein